MSVNQSLSSQSRVTKAREIHAANDMVDDGRNTGQSNIIQVKQAMHKPCTTSTLSQSHEMIETRSQQIIHKSYRFGVDTHTHKKTLTLLPPIPHILRGEDY